jgi:putative heme transporter
MTPTGEPITIALRTDRRSWVRPVMLWLSLLFVAWAVLRGLPEIRASTATLRDLQPALVLLALALEMLAVLTLPHVYRTSVEAVGARLRYRDALQVSMGAFTLSRVLPGGGAAGAVFAARQLTTFGVAGPVATVAVVLEGLLAMLTLGLVVAIPAGFAGLRGSVPPVYAVLAGISVLLFAAALVLGRALLRSPALRLSAGHLADRVLGRRVDITWRERLEDLAAHPPRWRAMGPVIGWSAINWVVDVAALWVMFAALGTILPLGVLILGFGAANLLTALPHTPGGLGVVEVGMTATYIAFGVDAPVAISGVLAYRLIAYWLPVGLGVPQYLRGATPTTEEPVTS